MNFSYREQANKKKKIFFFYDRLHVALRPRWCHGQTKKCPVTKPTVVPLLYIKCDCIGSTELLIRNFI